MCGRKTLTQGKLKIMEAFHVDEWDADFNWEPVYNIAPTHITPVLTVGERRVIRPMRWGLVPHWAEDLSIGSRMINARIETVAEKPAFKPLLNKSRCVIITDGYYEWQAGGRAKQPFYITSASEEFLPMAGLWTTWTDKTGKPVHTYTIITRPPAAPIAQIHDRMPAILTMDNLHIWADPAIGAAKALPYALSVEPKLNYHPVSTYVNSVNHNSPRCITPLTQLFQ